ncbi:MULTISPECIES: protein tyrosine phosphatase family protein [Novosphingobium]|uniref:beta-lactamase hydrolase domain-containing protein n=1 Tax=Novosphingobium TaxID=165696 RepID=UPI000D6E4A14|nr:MULTISPECIES: protein tyrosine phosphatase family protein [Novosphingobium]
MADPDDIRAWQRLDAQITTSGRLEDRDVARLADMGVRHVINLALETHPEALADEGDKLAAAGIAYTHIPVPFDAPDETHFRRFVAALEQGAKPVHVHCIMNWRVSAFFYRYHRDCCGMDEPAARAIMARQWSPDGHDRPEAAVWAQFIARS